MFKLSHFINIFSRIYKSLPTHLHSSIWFLFFLMSWLAFLELSSIMAITGYFSIMHNPFLITDLELFKNIALNFPILNTITSNHKIFVLYSCSIPIFLIVLKNIFSATVAWYSSLISERISAYIGLNIMHQFLYIKYDWHFTAENSKALTNMQWRYNLSQLLINILIAYSNLITVLLLFFGLILYDPNITIITLFVMGATSILTYALLRKHIDYSASNSAKAQSNENQVVMTAIGAVRELFIYQRQHIFLDAIQKHINDGMKPRTFLGISATVPTWTLESVGFLLIWFAVYFLVRWRDASVSAITMTVALLALTAWRVLPSLNRVVGATVMIRGLQSTALPCLEYFEQLKRSLPANNPAPAPTFSIDNEISLEAVSYRYPNMSVDALQDISLRIPVGKIVGIVGRSGAGKSTLINVLCGLLEPTSGRILVDKKPMSPEELAAYRMQVGYVPQSPYLLEGSVAQNVALRDWGRVCDMDRVRSACREAAIDFLGPDCEETDRMISPSGSGLSGGQIQRVAIARALYDRPSLLIMDEATSALDQYSEALVQEAVRKAAGMRTCVIAAHRLSTLNICDIVIWLDDGKLHAVGSPEYILSKYTQDLVTSCDTQG